MDFLHLDLECTGSNAQLGFNVPVSSFCRGEVLGGNALLKSLGLTRAYTQECCFFCCHICHTIQPLKEYIC